jgi:predicted transcriptional regulator
MNDPAPSPTPTPRPIRRIPVTYSLDPDLVNGIFQLAKTTGLPQSRIVDEAIRKHLRSAGQIVPARADAREQKSAAPGRAKRAP